MGAHYVRCRPDKAPAGPWRAPCSRAALEAHGGLVGIVPGSLECAVADVDRGDGCALAAMLAGAGFEARAVLPTRREGGAHLWFDRPPGLSIGNGQWRLGGDGRPEWAGDVRCDRGYVCIWGDGERCLLDALRERDAGGAPAPWPTCSAGPVST